MNIIMIEMDIAKRKSYVQQVVFVSVHGNVVLAQNAAIAIHGLSRLDVSSLTVFLVTNHRGLWPKSVLLNFVRSWRRIIT